MSRGGVSEDAGTSMRQHRSRLLQLAEHRSTSKSSWRRRGYSGSRSTSSPASTLLLNDPSYTPNIEHLVFPDRRNSNPSLGSPLTTKPPPAAPANTATTTAPAKPPRSRLAEVFALSRYTHSQTSHGSSTTNSGSAHTASTKTSSISRVSSRLLGGSHRRFLSGGSSATAPAASSTSSVKVQAPRPGLLLSARRWASEEPVREPPAPRVLPPPRASPEPGAARSSRPEHPQHGRRPSPQPRATPSPDDKAWPQRSASQHHKDSPDMASSRNMFGLRSVAQLLAQRYLSRRPWGSSSSTDQANTKNKGSNVSILHLRSSSENWGSSAPLSSYGTPAVGARLASARSAIPTLKYTAGSGGSLPAPQSSTAASTRGTNYASLPTTARRRDSATSMLFAGAGASVAAAKVSVDAGAEASRELSPVRWCDREVDGVYLNRSGWVQVQQRSLDESRRANYGGVLPPPPPPPAQAATTPTPPADTAATLPTRRAAKIANYHSSRSEPGRDPDIARPVFLPLPIDFSRRDFPPPRSVTPSPSHHDATSPPPVTPIISPPPAFQDPTNKHGAAPRARPAPGKAPFLPRSDAIVDSDAMSPPPSPPPPINWSTLPSPSPRAAPETSLAGRLRRLTPSPAATPLQPPHLQPPHARVPQARSMEEAAGPGSRRTLFQKHDSSSSSSSSFGFRSLDSSVVVPRAAMPRLSETDSSVGGYEDGDEASPFINNIGGFSAITSLEAPPPAGPKDRAAAVVEVERVSPSGRQRDAARLHQRPEQRPRRSPGSDSAGNSKKPASNNSSSSSSSSSSSCGRGLGSSQTFRRSVIHLAAPKQHSPPPPQHSPPPPQHSPPPPPQQPPPQQPVQYVWDPRGNRVRRSRSLQLPEARSPGAVSPPRDQHPPSEYQYFLVKNYVPQTHKQYYPAEQQHRLLMKIPPDQVLDRSRRNFVQHRKTQSEEMSYDNELRWDAEEEARVVTEYLYGSRSRAAARALLMQRYHSSKDSQDSRYSSQESRYHSKDMQDPPPASFNIVYLSRKQQQQSQPSRQRVLQRGTTTPTLYAASPELAPCSPNTCDFWPHCSHREGLYPPPSSHSKPSTPSPSSSTTKLPSSAAASIRLSHSYPSTQGQRRRGHDDKGGKRSDGSRGPSTRSSPASLERMEVLNGAVPLDRLGLYHSPEVEEKKAKWRGGGAQSLAASQIPRRPVTLVERLKSGMDAHVSPSERGDIPLLFAAAAAPAPPAAAVVMSAMSLDLDRKVSPSSAKGALSSASSSSSDVWVTTSDRTISKSPRPQKGSGASTPLEELSLSVGRSPVRGVQRPGSAPTGHAEDKLKAFFDAQQRSLSLPKSFLSPTFKPPKPSGVFPWKRQAVGGSPRTSAPSSPRLRPTTPEGAHTAPATPVKEAHSSAVGGQYRRSPGLSKSVRHKTSSCTPLEEPVTSRSDWDIRRAWSHGHSGEDQTVASTFLSSDTSSPLLSHPRLHEDKDLSQSQRSISGTNVSESVLQKFRKSLALKFQKRGSSSRETVVGEDGMDEPSEDQPPQPPAAAEPPPASQPQPKDDSANDPKFKFGPLVWRSSKERKKGKKAARNAKCNSGDSGIQLEMAAGSHTAGDSSESHDTDHLGDDEPLDEMDSPPAVRRRVNSKSSDKSSRPQSEVINQILIDKFKADLQTRTHPRHQNVRRTHSDLGGQRIFNWDVRNSYRRMFSTPSPIKMRPPRTSPPRPANTSTVTLRSSKRRASRPQLRRSISQPLGLNELSPLMRRKPCGLPAPRASTSNVLSEDEHDGRGGAGTSDDEMMSDSESSVASLTDRKKSFEQSMDEELAILAEAVWDHVAMEPEELAFRAGDVVEVLDTVDKDWWWGARGDHTGWFPAAFVRLRVSQEDTVEDCLAAMAAGSASVSQLRRRTSISLLSNDQVRTSVVRELVNTERDFVKVLRDVAEGYLAECKRRSDMFSADQINTIFGNLEELLRFQSVFLADLEARIDWEAPHRSCVGECFLNHRAGFRIYSEYCNSHPLATATLQELYQHNSYSKFFEACRLMRGLIEIPLDGYLLTPVQRICKYPLQLAELFKYTKADHPDYDTIQEALDAMRDVAVLINERKRRMESLEKLAAWQQRVEGWEGEDLIEVSSQLIHQGEVVRVTTGMWTSNITLFLFDHQLVYCKKDILKRNTYVYKGRIDLETSEVVDVPDGKDPQLGVTVRHGLKVYNHTRDKWLMFCCRSAEEKVQWLESLREERQLVARDQRDGLEFPPAARQLARAAAKRQRRPPSKPRSKSYKRDPALYGVSRLNSGGASHLSLAASGPSTHSLGRKVGTWFTFGSSKKRHVLARSSPHHDPA